MEKKTIVLFQLIVGIFLLGLTIYIIGIEQIIEGFAQLNYVFVIPLILLQIILLMMGAFNIWLLFRPLCSKRVKYFQIFKYYSISSTISLFAPGRLGDFSIIYFLKKEGITVGQGTSLTIFDKIISFIVIIVLSLLAFWYFFLPQNLFLIVIILPLFIPAGIFVLLSKKCRDIIKRILPAKYAALFKGFNNANVLYLKEHKLLLIYNILLTFVRTAMMAFLTYVVFISLNVSIAYWPILLITGLMQLIKLIPITISGIGTTHIFRYYMYSTYLFVSSSTIGAMLSILLLLRYGILISFFFLFGGSPLRKEKIADKMD